jgi:hypothetical protein
MLDSDNDVKDFIKPYLDSIRDLQDSRYSALIQRMETARYIDLTDTNVLVADFAKDDNTPLEISSTVGVKGLSGLLHTRPIFAHGRLIVVSSTSGLSGASIAPSLQGSWVTDSSANAVFPRFDPHRNPRSAPWVYKRQNPNHVSRQPDVNIMSCIAACSWMDPNFLLRFLHPQYHLAYQSFTSQCSIVETKSAWRGSWKALHIGIDQDNYTIVAIDQRNDASPWTSELSGRCYLWGANRLQVIIMTVEDNCLGIDLNPGSDTQPYLPSAKSPSQIFKGRLLQLVSLHTERQDIVTDPYLLVSLYSTASVASFAAQLELYRRHWRLIYEPWANTSVAHDVSQHRVAVRALSRKYSAHLCYVKHTSLILDCFLTSHPDSVRLTISLRPLKMDFEHFVSDLEDLKLQCERFLEQQVGKLALQESRAQIRDAKDVQRITYLAFVFVPLNLVSSFFGMNVKELNSGSVSVWVFFVAAAVFLIVSLLVVWLARTALERLSIAFQGTDVARFRPDLPSDLYED